MFFVSWLFVGQALAATTGSITGFAWGGNDLINGVQTGVSSIGWMSFSSLNLNCDTNNDGKSEGGTNCPAAGLSVGSYGVTMTDDGNNSTATLSGYAWSDSLGWISFKTADLTGCPSGTCKAWLDTTCPSNKCYFNGWAKVISVNAGNEGGWDGWIRLNNNGICDTNNDGKSEGGTGCPASGTVVYGVYADKSSGNLVGYASSSADPTTGTIGWVKLTGMGAKIIYPFITKPVAKMACDATGCPGTKVQCGCDASGNNCAANWIMYQPIATPGCNFQLNNFSTNTSDPSTTSTWVIGASQTTCSGKCDYGTVQKNIVPGSYTVSLTMQNSAGPDTATHSLQILNDVHAGLMCSFDDHVWQVCSSPSFMNNVTKNEKIYVRDDQAISSGNSNYSWPSDGATIFSRTWNLNNNSINPTDPNTPHNPLINGIETSGIMAQKTNTLSLLVTDSIGRTDTRTYTFTANSLPQWQEISPIGTVWKNLFAGVFGIINSIPR